MMKTKQLLWVVLLFLLLASSLSAQTSRSVPLGTPTVILSWDYPPTEEARIDEFQVQRTYIEPTSVPAGPFPGTLIIPKTSRSYVFTIPAAVVVGAKGYFRVVARKAGQADSAPTNTVEVIILPAQQLPLAAPTNIRIE